ncbi:hypothetical protein VXC74_13810 [Clostridioides difficile]|uniref:hypothetical protein n=1 Tax=Clostridioides difficile TaxID=1496 RepID=UPI0022A51B68|nr:hypothetical protein [Clostridioides difficile]
MVKDVKLKKGMCRDEVNRLLKENDVDLELVDEIYGGVDYKYNWKCKCGEVFIRKWNYVKKTELNSCMKCMKNSLSKEISNVKSNNIREVKILKGMDKKYVNKILEKWIELLDDTYRGSKYVHNWKCKCGEIFERKYEDVRIGNSYKCKKCTAIIKNKVNNIKNIKISKGMNKKEINLLIREWLILEDDIYLGYKYKHNWKCKCGEIFERTWDSIKRNNSIQCKKCTFNIKNDPNSINEVYLEKNMTKENVNKLIRDWLTLEDNVFLEHHYKHTWKCKCGNTFKRTWSKIRVRENYICDECKYKLQEDRYRYEVEKDGEYEYIKSIRKNECLSSGEIVRSSPYIKIKHKYCDSIYEISAAQFIDVGIRCSNCCQKRENSFAHYIEEELGEQLETYWDFKRNKVNPYYIHKNYIGNKDNKEKIWIKCTENNNHASYQTMSYSFIKGSRCPICSESKGEKRIRNYFNNKSIEYHMQQEFDGLFGLGDRNLSYDFYLPNYKLLIEYQGEFHDGTITGSYKEYFNLEKQQEHDRRKREYAKNNGYKLLEIWYWDFDNIEEILDKEIGSLL